MSAQVNSRAEFVTGVRTQTRVVGALLMREIITRYGRHNIGFMWLFVEPMMFTVGIVLIWSAFKTHAVRLPLLPFTILGYSSVLLWRNTVNRCGNAIEPNRALLHHRNVRVIDLYLARLILEAAGATISLLTLSTVMMLAGLMPAPDDIVKMVIAWALLAWFSMGLGLLIGSVAAWSESAERIWHVFTYLFLPLSGAFFVVDWLPKHVQAWALLVPTVDCVELLRGGYFGPSIHAHYDLTYVVVVNIVLSLIGLLMVKRASARVEGE